MNSNITIEQHYRRYVDRYVDFYEYKWSELVNEIIGAIDVEISKTTNPVYLLLNKLAYCTLALHLWETGQLAKDVLPTVYKTNSLPVVKIIYDTPHLLGVISRNGRNVVVFQDLKDTTIWDALY